MKKSIFQLRSIFFSLLLVSLLQVGYTINGCVERWFTVNQIIWMILICIVLIGTAIFLPLIGKRLIGKTNLNQRIVNNPGFSKIVCAELENFIGALHKETDAGTDERAMYLQYILNNCTLESLDHILIYEFKNSLLAGEDWELLRNFRKKEFNPPLLGILDTWTDFRHTSRGHIEELAQLIFNEFVKNGFDVSCELIAKKIVPFLKKSGLNERGIRDITNEINNIFYHDEPIGYLSSDLRDKLSSAIEVELEMKIM